MINKLTSIFNKFLPKPAQRDPLEAVLEELGVTNFTRRTDGTYYVVGNIDVSQKNLTALPDLSRVNMLGHFRCNGNPLKNLKGAPSKVNGDFICSDIESLEGAPQEVFGKFSCMFSKIGNLKGAPRIVHGAFECTFNDRLETLEGGPVSVGGIYDCSDCALTTLKGAPLDMDSSLKCDNNKLTSLEGAPRKMGRGWLICENNPLQSLAHVPKIFGYLYSPFGTFKGYKDLIESPMLSDEHRTAIQGVTAPPAEKTREETRADVLAEMIVDHDKPVVVARFKLPARL